MNRVFYVTGRRTESFYKYFHNPFVAESKRVVYREHPDLEAELDVMPQEHHTNCGGVLEPIGVIKKSYVTLVEYKCMKCGEIVDSSNYKAFEINQDED